MKQFVLVIMVLCYTLLAKETQILAIHSYHELYPWTQSQRTGFRAVLNNTPNLFPLFRLNTLIPNAEYLIWSMKLKLSII